MCPVTGGRVSVPAALRIAISFEANDFLCGGKGLPPSQTQHESRPGERGSVRAPLRAGTEPALPFSALIAQVIPAPGRPY